MGRSIRVGKSRKRRWIDVQSRIPAQQLQRPPASLRGIKWPSRDYPAGIGGIFSRQYPRSRNFPGGVIQVRGPKRSDARPPDLLVGDDILSQQAERPIIIIGLGRKPPVVLIGNHYCLVGWVICEELLLPVCEVTRQRAARGRGQPDRKSTRLNSSHLGISYAL